MDFRFTPEQEAFREEVADFLKRELPPGWKGLGMMGYRETEEEWAVHRRIARKLGEKHWLGLKWPKEFGGMGWGPIEWVVFRDEMVYHSAPGLDIVGVGMLGPTLVAHGSEEQKKEFLPPIARGEVLWCQCFSEPNAGSDLASLQLRAQEEGDYFVLNGQKVWQSWGHWADRGFVLARTNPQEPRHKGLSFFLLDMKSPGITTRPLLFLDDTHPVCEVYFDNVRVHKRNMVGEKNRGWYVALFLLDVERSCIEYSAGGRRFLEMLLQCAQDVPVLRSRAKLMVQRLAEAAVEVEICRLMSYHIAWMESKGLIPSGEAAMIKVFGSEVGQRLLKTAGEILGPYIQLAPGSKRAVLGGMLAREYLSSSSYAVDGGTSEIMRNVLALQGLGLPRS